jgi:hypothetical protein
LLEVKHPIIVDGRASREPLGPHQEQARRDADAYEAAHSGYDRGADGGEGDYIRIHEESGEWRVASRGQSRAPGT